MKRFQVMVAAAAIALIALAGDAMAQCGQRQVDPTNALLGIQGCANGQCNLAPAAASASSSVSALQSEVRALRAQLAASRPTSVYRMASAPGGGASASASASSAPRTAANRTLYVVPSAVEVYGAPQDSAASASASASSSAAASSVDAVQSQFALVPLSASDVQVSNACGSGKRSGILGGRLRARRGGSFSKSVAISST